MRMIPTIKALEITGHAHRSGLYAWIERHNIRHPERLIVRRRGMVDVETLQEALIKISAPKEAQQ